MPKATNVFAITESFIPIVQPSNVATSPTNAIKIPITIIATKKHSQPKQIKCLLINIFKIL